MTGRWFIVATAVAIAATGVAILLRGSSDAERAILLILSEEQPGNEEPAQHKKKTDSRGSW